MTKNTVTKITWGSKPVCDTTYWKTANGCNGTAVPWGLNTISNFVPAGASAAKEGSLRAWHFLADKVGDKTKVWSIEKNDKLNVLFYEFIDRSAGAAAAQTAYASSD